jgi:hypothetical protein
MTMQLAATAAASAPDLTALIAECAYYKAERRGFAPGLELEDWLAAESEICARAAPAAKPKKSRGRKTP